MILVAALLLVGAPDRAQQCSPDRSEGVSVKVDQRYARVTMDRFVSTYFSEAFNDAAAPVMGIKSRKLVSDALTSNGLRQRVVRMRPATTLPGPLRVFGSDDQLRYDEITTYDKKAQQLRFVIDNEACDRLKYGGTIAFVPDGDGVRLRIDAVLQVDAPFVGDIVERLVRGGVRDGYGKLAGFMQRYLDKHAPGAR